MDKKKMRTWIIAIIVAVIYLIVSILFNLGIFLVDMGGLCYI